MLEINRQLLVKGGGPVTYRGLRDYFQKFVLILCINFLRTMDFYCLFMKFVLLSAFIPPALMWRYFNENR